MKLLVADDHALVRQGLLGLLRDAHPDWSFDEAGTLDEALEALSREPTDLLVLDLNMPGMDRSTSLQALREAYPATRIAVLTATEEREIILECLSAGVHGYILKSDAVGQLVYAIEAVLQGQVYVPPTLTRLVQAAGVPPPPPLAPSPAAKEIGLTPPAIRRAGPAGGGAFHQGHRPAPQPGRWHGEGSPGRRLSRARGAEPHGSRRQGGEIQAGTIIAAQAPGWCGVASPATKRAWERALPARGNPIPAVPG